MLGIITTYRGKRINIQDPNIDDICIEDIAHSLAYTCRFNGHSPFFYSTAQHSIIMSYRCEHSLEGLLHDAPEYLTGDIISPFKNLPEMKFARDLEDFIYGIIATKYNALPVIPEDVKMMDKLVLDLEYNNLFIKKDPSFAMTPERAEQEFLERFECLKK